MAVKPQEKQYQSAYSTAINDLVNKAINREAFSYDPATDVAYQSYARQYQRLGDESARDTLADVSAQTGGLASSYAVTAAQQARNQYNQALTDKIPSLMEAAYQKYRDEYNDALAGASTLQGIDDSQYNRFATDRDYNRGVYESDRDFSENVRQYNQNYALDKQTADFERMLNTWSTMGKASKSVANYFGVPVGTKTNEAAYQAAQLALDKAKFAASLKGSGGGSGRSGGRRGGRRGGSGSSGKNSAKYIAAMGLNAVTDALAATGGGTKNAKNYLGNLGKYLAQGGTNGGKQSLAVQQVQNAKGLNKMEKLWVLQKLNGR